MKTKEQLLEYAEIAYRFKVKYIENLIATAMSNRLDKVEYVCNKALYEKLSKDIGEAGFRTEFSSLCVPYRDDKDEKMIIYI